MRSTLFVRAVAAFAVLGLSACNNAAATVIDATPANLRSKLASAQPGDTIKLAGGAYSNLQIAGRSYSPAITIDALAARLTDVRLTNTQGVTIEGGTYGIGQPERHPKTGKPVYGPAILLNDVEGVSINGATFNGPGAIEGPGRLEYGEGIGVRAVKSREVSVKDSRFAGLRIGVTMTRMDGFRLAGNTFQGMRMDGIAVSMSRNGLVEKNECSGTRVRSDEHPDCIQMWSRPEAPPTADVVIRGNRISGSTQGIGLHNHVRNGVDDGGFDRIVIEDNEIHVSRSNAINLQNGRESVIRNNRVSTEPGARLDARIRFSGETVKLCGNTVEAGKVLPAVKDQAC